MRLTPVEQERLWLFLAAELARRRRAAGLRLNHPEAVALICDELIEAARAGKSYDEVRALGHQVLSE
jgi:urease subunit gamma/beta